MPTIASLNVNLTAGTSSFQKAMSKANGMVNTFQASVMRAATSIPALFGVSLGAGGAMLGLKNLALGSEAFNVAMTNSVAIMDDVNASMKAKLGQAAIDTAKVTKFSATQIAESYMFLASSGLDAQQTIAAMPVVAKFAQAGQFELALATDLLADAQSALGLNVKDTSKNMINMRRVSDVLVKGNIISNSSVEDLSKALTNKAAAAVRALGKDMEEGVAVLAAYADQGLKGEEAGTALNIVLRDLQNAALGNAAAFKANRIAVFDSQGEMRNIALIVEDIERALKGMTDAQRKATLSQLGFTDKSVAFTEVLIGTSGKIKEFEGALRAAGGATDEVASKNITPFQASLQRMRGSWAELGQVVGPPLLGVLADFNNLVASSIDVLLKHNDPMRAFNEGFKNAKEGIKEAELSIWEKGLRNTLSLLGDVNKQFAEMFDWMGKLNPGNGGADFGINAAASAGWNFAMNMIRGPKGSFLDLVFRNFIDEQKPQGGQAAKVQNFGAAGKAAGTAARNAGMIYDHVTESGKQLFTEVEAAGNVFKKAFEGVFTPYQAQPLFHGGPAMPRISDLTQGIIDFQEKFKPTNKGPELIRAGSSEAFNFGRSAQSQQNQPINQVQNNTKNTVTELINIGRALKDGIKLQNVTLVEGFA